MGTRRRARELALQLLYQFELTNASPEEMQAGFEEWRNASDEVREFADTLLRGTLSRIDELDEELSRQTTHWRLERLAAVDRNILRLAMYELICETGTPHAVVIDEAIEIAKKYGTKDSGRFVNGVLDGFVKRRSAAG
ncbi:MAG: transcription antitermination factor NusB [Acidobacteria bacterium]|jgi:N utilization substance protein B|nr:transcription antitermination factor NusB [Acidobacteriota bacterium]